MQQNTGHTLVQVLSMLIEPVNPEQASEGQRAAFAAARKRFGRDLPLVGVMAHHDQVAAVADLPRFRDSDAYSPGERAALEAAGFCPIGERAASDASSS